MKNKSCCFFLLILPIIFSCKQNNSKIDQTKTDTLIAPKIIELCIDSVLVLDSAINTESYYVDIEYLRKDYPNLVSEYINDYPKANITNFDSLVKTRSAWLKNEFQKNDVIQFKSLQLFGDTIVVETTKKRFVDASFGAEIGFKKKEGKLICIKRDITWIN
jgi:hypothetical protein